MADNIDTIPASIQHASDEDRVRTFDATAELPGAATVTAPVLVLKNAAGTVVTLADAPTASGKTILWRIRAGVLTRGSYYLFFRFTPSGSTNVIEARLRIVCPF